MKKELIFKERVEEKGSYLCYVCNKDMTHKEPFFVKGSILALLKEVEPETFYLICKDCVIVLANEIEKILE